MKTGDVVELKSGGPFMTVETTTTNNVICVWFFNAIQYRDTFKVETLKIKGE